MEGRSEPDQYLNLKFKPLEKSKDISSAFISSPELEEILSLYIRGSEK